MVALEHLGNMQQCNVPPGVLMALITAVFLSHLGPAMACHSFHPGPLYTYLHTGS